MVHGPGKEFHRARNGGISLGELDLIGLEAGITPRQDATLVIRRANGETEEVPVTVRIDTPIEVEYYRHGGILPYVLRQLME